MEEKILIKSQKYDVKKLFKAFIVIGLIMALLLLSITFITQLASQNYRTHEFSISCVNGYDGDVRDKTVEKYYDYFESLGYKWIESFEASSEYISESEFLLQLIENGDLNLEYDCYYCTSSNAFSAEIKGYFDDLFSVSLYDFNIIYVVLIFVLFVIIGAVVYLWLNSYSLTVSDKRVSGEVLFGKKIDLPIDFVSAISVISLLKGVGISTSSGKISFLAIKNSAEIYDTINNLLIERQKENEKPTIQTVEVKSDEADQLKKYKDLLESGVITQDEFDAKKKQLLGL